MTHFIVTAAGTSGDVLPFIEICRHLKQRAKKVTLITSPYFHAEARKSGIDFQELGSLTETEKLYGNSALWTEDRGFITLWKGCIEKHVDTIRRYVSQLNRSEDVVIICHFNVMPLADIARAEKRRIRIISCYLSPGTIRSQFGKFNIGSVEIDEDYPPKLKNKLFSWIDRNYFNAEILPALNRHRAHLGLYPIENFLPYVQTAADAYATLFPAWYRPKAPDWPAPLIEGDFLFRRKTSVTGFSKPLKQFLKENESPVLITAGTANSSASAFFKTAQQATKALGLSAMYLTKQRTQLPRNLENNSIWLKYCDLRTTLQYSAGCVSHGGIGTVADAMQAGVPQIIVPFAHDQFDNARTIEELGVGLSIPAKQLTIDKLTTSLKKVLSDQRIKMKCRKIASKFIQNSAIDALVEKFVRLGET